MRDGLKAHPFPVHASLRFGPHAMRSKFRGINHGPGSRTPSWRIALLRWEAAYWIAFQQLSGAAGQAPTITQFGVKLAIVRNFPISKKKRKRLCSGGVGPGLFDREQTRRPLRTSTRGWTLSE